MATLSSYNLRSLRESIVYAHIQAETVHHDIDATIATFHHPRYEVPAMGGTIDGREAVQSLLSALLTAFPDFWLEITALHHADAAVIVECNFGGTHRGTWAGLAPTDKAMEVQAVLIYVFEGERLVCEKVYFDHATVVRQLLG